MLSMVVSVLQTLCCCHVDTENCASTAPAGVCSSANLPGEFHEPAADQDVLLQM